MRFEVSRVMDSIERRLTTDVTLAQAVVDLGEVARFAELDGGRPVNLLRVGMAVDALSRYLVDAGAMLYGVVGRELMSESALTSKERMVLGRWADDGLIEVTTGVADRAVEIADLTGLPLLAVRPYTEFAERFPWLKDNPERVLRMAPRGGSAVLSPVDGAEVDPAVARAIAVGKAPVGDGVAAAGEAVPLDVFAPHGAQRISHTMVVRRRFIRAAPSELGASLTAREWRCADDMCAAFGEHRLPGQPLPRLRDGVAACPRHGTPLRDIGSRPPSYAISVVVDDLARQRFVVRAERPVSVGVAASEDAEVISVGEWAHEAAKAWIGPVHVRLEVRDGALVVTDVSRTGTVIWRRSGPEDSGHTTWLRGSSYALGDWDTVELYTGFELVRGDRRLATVVGRSEPLSVLLDAPTVAVPQLS